MQERLAADAMEVQREFLRAHSLRKSEQLTVVENGQVVFHPKFLLDLDLAPVELELTERTDLSESINFGLFEVDHLLIGDVKGVNNIISPFVVSWPISADDGKPLTAILLIARAELPDSNFRDSVVLVMNNIGSVPGRLIISRSTGIAVARLSPDLERLAQMNDKVYFGGPVAIASVSFLFRADTPPEHATQVLDGIYVGMSLELLRKLLSREAHGWIVNLYRPLGVGACSA